MKTEVRGQGAEVRGQEAGGSDQNSEVPQTERRAPTATWVSRLAFSPLTPALSPLRGEGRESKDERSSECEWQMNCYICLFA